MALTPLSIRDARQLGYAKLQINDERFSKGYDVAIKMEARQQDLGVMSLAFAIIGGIATPNMNILQQELKGALQLVGMAQKEWEMERKVQGMR